MELPVKLQKEITTFVHHAYKLCILLAYECFYPWYYENYADVEMIIDHVKLSDSSSEEKRLRLDYRRVPYDELFEIRSISFKELKDNENIIELVKKTLNLGCYLTIHVDDYYIPEKMNFEKCHFIHETIVYGYDDISGKVLTIGFNDGFEFLKQNIDYEIFNEAFQNAKSYYKHSTPWAEDRAVQLIKPKTDIKYRFDKKRFADRLKEYGKPVKMNCKRTSFLDRIKRCLWLPYAYTEAEIEAKGIDTYDIIIRSMKDCFEDLRKPDYRVFHLLAEHKKGIYSRLNYIAGDNDQIKNLAEEYKDKVIKLFEKIRLVYLKETCKEYNFSIIYLPIKNEAVADKVVGMIRTARKAERKILRRICRELEK